jgi:hypothetical protein
MLLDVCVCFLGFLVCVFWNYNVSNVHCFIVQVWYPRLLFQFVMCIQAQWVILNMVMGKKRKWNGCFSLEEQVRATRRMIDVKNVVLLQEN